MSINNKKNPPKKAIRQDNESVQIVFITGYSEYIADAYAQINQK